MVQGVVLREEVLAVVVAVGLADDGVDVEAFGLRSAGHFTSAAKNSPISVPSERVTTTRVTRA
jgi:hypothetical protein